MTHDFRPPQKTTGLDTNAPAGKQSRFASRPFARVPKYGISPEVLQTMRERVARLERSGDPMAKAWGNISLAPDSADQPSVQAKPEQPDFQTILQRSERVDTPLQRMIQAQMAKAQSLKQQEEEELQTKSEPTVQRETLPEEEKEENLQMKADEAVQQEGLLINQTSVPITPLKANQSALVQKQGYGYEDEERMMSVPISYGYEDEERMMSVWNEGDQTPDPRPPLGTAHKQPKEMIGCNLTEKEVKSSSKWCLDRYQQHKNETCYREIPKNSLGGRQYCYTSDGRCHNSQDKVSPASPDSQGFGKKCGFNLRRFADHIKEDVFP